MSTDLENIPPNGGIKFKIVPLTESLGIADSLRPFIPAFYPDRFNQKTQKDLRRAGSQCEGEDVSIKKQKNSEFHASGIVLAENVRVLQKLYKHNGPVDLLTPISPDGGMHCVIEKGDIGDIAGWNPMEEQWMFNYTIDFVSTGDDEFGGSGTNGVVSEMLAYYEGNGLDDL